MKKATDDTKMQSAVHMLIFRISEEEEEIYVLEIMTSIILIQEDMLKLYEWPKTVTQPQLLQQDHLNVLGVTRNIQTIFLMF